MSLHKPPNPPLRCPAGVQQLPVYGHGHQASRHGLLQLVDVALARQWLQALLHKGWLTLAGVKPLPGVKPPAWALSLGLSHAGLLALGLAPRLLALLQERAPAFAQGAVQRAAAQLGDTGDNGAAHWEPAFGQQQAQLLLSLHADRGSRLQARWRALSRLPGAAGLAGWDSGYSDGEHLSPVRSARTVHFGYLDGIANPRFEQLHRPPQGDLPALQATGELLLGHLRNDGTNPWALGDEPEAAAFFHHACFGAYRKIEQHEAVFRQFIHSQAQALGQQPDWLKAKLCGRWPADGRRTLPEGITAKPGANLDDFDFSDDPLGAGCPMGAHIRRLNPRADPLAQPRRRPLMRRGMPYGPAWSEAEVTAPSRGLLGLFFCSSLEHQFEHLLGAWADRRPLGPVNPGNAKDPLIGQHDDPKAWLAIPGPPGTAPLRLGGWRPFVATLGTVYLLYPTAQALQALVQAGASAPLAGTGTLKT